MPARAQRLRDVRARRLLAAHQLDHDPRLLVRQHRVDVRGQLRRQHAGARARGVAHQHAAQLQVPPHALREARLARAQRLDHAAADVAGAEQRDPDRLHAHEPPPADVTGTRDCSDSRVLTTRSKIQRSSSSERSISTLTVGRSASIHSSSRVLTSVSIWSLLEWPRCVPLLDSVDVEERRLAHDRADRAGLQLPQRHLRRGRERRQRLPPEVAAGPGQVRLGGALAGELREIRVAKRQRAHLLGGRVVRQADAREQELLGLLADVGGELVAQPLDQHLATHDLVVLVTREVRGAQQRREGVRKALLVVAVREPETVVQLRVELLVGQLADERGCALQHHRGVLDAQQRVVEQPVHRAQTGRAELQLVDGAARHLGGVVVALANPQHVRPRRQVLGDVEADEHDDASDREQPDQAGDDQSFSALGASVALSP